MLALSFAAFCQVQGVGELSFAAQGAPMEAASDDRLISYADDEAAVDDSGCTRQRHAAGAGCSFDAVSAWPVAVAPMPGLKPVPWREADQRLTKIGQIPDLRPPIFLSLRLAA